MKPPPVRYERADSVEGALQFLASSGDSAKVLAGGQSLVALLNLRLARPEVLLDIWPLGELREYGRSDGTLKIGALTTQRALERDDAIHESCPLLAEAIPYVGHVAIRNRGTIGGTVAHADPAAEVPVVLAALDGSVTLRSAYGERSVPAREFFKGFLMTATSPDELVTSISFPVIAPGTGVAFEEFARRTGDFAIVSVACVVDRGDDGSVRAARLVLGGVATAPLLVEGLDAIAGARGADAARAAAEIVEGAIEPADDIHGTSAYRRRLASELVKRAIQRAAEGRG